MFKALTAWLRRGSEVPATEVALRKRVQRLEIALGELHDDLAALETRHTTLAKRSYGRLGGRPPNAPPEDAAPLTKAQLRAKLGIVPGRPFQPRLDEDSHGN